MISFSRAAFHWWTYKLAKLRKCCYSKQTVHWTLHTSPSDGHNCPPAQPRPTLSFWDGTVGGDGGETIRNSLSWNPLPTNMITVSSHTVAYSAVWTAFKFSRSSNTPYQITFKQQKRKQGITAGGFCACQTTGPHNRPDLFMLSQNKASSTVARQCLKHQLNRPLHLS